MNSREEFEFRFPVPAGLRWSEKQQDYFHEHIHALQAAVNYSKMWQVWKAARTQPATCPHCESGDVEAVEPAGSLHPAVLQFAKHMQIKLDANKHKDGEGWDRNPDGSRNGWSGCSEFFLRGKLREESSELEEALVSGDKEQIRLEAADVGNIAMMLADNFGGLSYIHPTPSQAVRSGDGVPEGRVSVPTVLAERLIIDAESWLSCYGEPEEGDYYAAFVDLQELISSPPAEGED